MRNREIFSVSAGALLVCLTLYGAAGVLAGRFRAARACRHSKPVLTLPPVFPGAGASFAVPAGFRLNSWPGVRNYYRALFEFTVVHKPDREDDAEKELMRTADFRFSLKPGRIAVEASIANPARGEYESVRREIVFEDAWGFARCAFPLDEQIRLVVPPLPGQDGDAPLPDLRREGEGASPYLRTGEDFLEIRPYQPGDDPAKINWKLYAHTGTLLTRVQEKIPVEKAPLLVVIDTGVTPLAGSRGQRDIADLLASTYASLVERLSAAGYSLCLCRPGAAPVEVLPGGGDPETADVPSWKTVFAGFAAFQGVRWKSEERRFEVDLRLPEKRPSGALVFSSQGSPVLPDLLETLRSEGQRPLLFRKSIPLPAHGAGFSWPSFFFVPGEDRPPRRDASFFRLRGVSRAFVQRASLPVRPYVEAVIEI